MKNMTLTLEMLRDANFPEGGLHVVLDGILYIGREGFFVEFSDEGIRIPIVEFEIDKRLLRTVPCYLGGPCLYNDTVRIVANLQKTNNTVEITSIDSGVLYRDDDDESYTF